MTATKSRYSSIILLHTYTPSFPFLWMHICACTSTGLPPELPTCPATLLVLVGCCRLRAKLLSCDVRAVTWSHGTTFDFTKQMQSQYIAALSMCIFLGCISYTSQLQCSQVIFQESESLVPRHQPHNAAIVQRNESSKRRREQPQDSPNYTVTSLRDCFTYAAP